MENNCYIYVLGDDSGIKYLGVSKYPDRRFKHHIYNSLNKNSKEYNLRKSRWIRKRNCEIKYRVIFKGSEEECYKKEVELIQKLKDKNKKLVNTSLGGDKPPNIKDLPNYKDIVEKIRNKAKNRRISLETRLKMSICKKRTQPKWLNKDVTGSNNPNSKKVDMYDIQNNYIKTFNTYKEAAIFCGVNPSTFSEYVKKRNIYKNYIWKPV